MRGVGLQYPYDSYLFNPSERFTDWLISYEWALSNNPWDVNSEMIKHIPPCPYGPLTFYYQYLTSPMGRVLPFFILALTFLIINLSILKQSLSNKDINLSTLIFVVLVVGFYPLHFAIDRGNVVVLGAVLISCLYYILHKALCLGEEYLFKSRLIVEVAIILLVGTKPTWALVLPVLYFISLTSFLRGVCLVSLIYATPIFLGMANLEDYISSARLAVKIMENAINFQSDVSAGLLVFMKTLGFEVNLKLIRNLFLVIGGVVYLGGFIFLMKIKTTQSVKILTFLTHAIFCTFLFNRPGPDYNLMIVIPIFIVYIDYLHGSRLLSKWIGFVVVVLFFCIGTWFTIYTDAGQSLWTPIRSLSLLICELSVLLIAHHSRCRN
jgi:hypothetical protein